ncbi:MAG: hypothetical protein LBD28_04570, partial [Tannerellaceae bacterium]|nr:hypothetical protein [Tannerellaceae bacterium]
MQFLEILPKNKIAISASTSLPFFTPGFTPPVKYVKDSCAFDNFPFKQYLAFRTDFGGLFFLVVNNVGGSSDLLTETSNIVG